ncbi:MAG: ROK family protein [Candidatus Sungiibacteriota bacterium]|uniref:ROK family protein n=1 Tax=Candidatus Sungiibacteriota bacterium TaxID=2750080 RepID=A0A7T5RJ32_9BACT|nr:MAG: ROK family protein [Candidatus Sungbacteria bacterium]
MAYYLGVDIGGTKIRAVLMQGLDDRKPQCFVITTPKNKKRFLDVLWKFLRKVAGPKKLTGIGVGVPGVVNKNRGTLIKAPNLSFLNGWNANKFFARFKVPVRTDNDSRCFLRAEAIRGAGKGYKNIVALTIGTGIGGGIMIDGKIYYGSRSGAGEFGHMIVGNNKTFEQLAGKRAFLKYGDRSKLIGVGVANLINAFDPDIVILGGGGVTSGAVKIGMVRRLAKKYTMSPPAQKTPIVRGKLGDTAAAMGAVLLWKKGY